MFSFWRGNCVHSCVHPSKVYLQVPIHQRASTKARNVISIKSPKAGPNPNEWQCTWVHIDILAKHGPFCFPKALLLSRGSHLIPFAFDLLTCGEGAEKHSSCANLCCGSPLAGTKLGFSLDSHLKKLLSVTHPLLLKKKKKNSARTIKEDLAPGQWRQLGPPFPRCWDSQTSPRTFCLQDQLPPPHVFDVPIPAPSLMAVAAVGWQLGCGASA